MKQKEKGFYLDPNPQLAVMPPWVRLMTFYIWSWDACHWFSWKSGLSLSKLADVVAPNQFSVGLLISILYLVIRWGNGFPFYSLVFALGFSCLLPSHLLVRNEKKEVERIENRMGNCFSSCVKLRGDSISSLFSMFLLWSLIWFQLFDRSLPRVGIHICYIFDHMILLLDCIHMYIQYGF